MSKTRPTAYDPSQRIAAAHQSLAQGIGRALLEKLLAEGEQSQDSPRLTVKRAERSMAPALFASVHPGDAAARAEAKALYERCLQTYREVLAAQDGDSSEDNAGAALAFFVAVNMSALREIDVTDDLLRRLEHQLAAVARVTSAWSSASLVERQMYFERLATAGVLVAGKAAHTKSDPAATAETHQIARGYLQQMLGVDPDLLVLGPEGLALRQATHAA